jgi:hypothetical protein
MSAQQYLLGYWAGPDQVFWSGPTLVHLRNIDSPLFTFRIVEEGIEKKNKKRRREKKKNKEKELAMAHGGAVGD